MKFIIDVNINESAFQNYTPDEVADEIVEACNHNAIDVTLSPLPEHQQTTKQTE